MNKKFKNILVVDSREQKSLDFKESCFDEIIVDGLPFGDYWNFWRFEDGEEMTIPIAWERKSLSDLYGTMTQGYERFKREMEKAKENNFQLILVIENSMRDVAKGYEHSQFSGDSMLKKLAMLRVKYDLEYHFFNDRREMARYIEEIFLAVGRMYKKGNKNGQDKVSGVEGSSGKTEEVYASD